MKNYLKKFLGISIMLFFCHSLQAQEESEVTYKIINNGSVLNIQPYVDALNNSNMHNHRLKSSRYTIVFNTGVTVQLFSAEELLANGRTITLSDYPENFDSNRNEPTFFLGANNFIMEQHSNTSKK